RTPPRVRPPGPGGTLLVCVPGAAAAPPRRWPRPPLGSGCPIRSGSLSVGPEGVRPALPLEDARPLLVGDGGPELADRLVGLEGEDLDLGREGVAEVGGGE